MEGMVEELGTPPGLEIKSAEELEFKLTGMEELQNDLASLLATFTTTPTTDGGSSTSPGISDEESSGPPTPHVLEAATPMPEPAQKKGWGPPPATKEVRPEETHQTSVTLQNVPRICTRDYLAKRLNEAGFLGDYDFIYVVADLKQRNCGSGSALVNFCNEEARARFTATFHKAGASVAFPGFVGKKAIEVVPAPIQGLEANVQKLGKSGVLMSMLAERPGWLPARYNDAGEVEAEIGA